MKELSELEKLLLEMPVALKGNGLIYGLTIKQISQQWRVGYYCLYDGIWRVHVDSDTKLDALLQLKERVGVYQPEFVKH